MRYRDRQEAGKMLAGLIPPLDLPASVLAIPNGGVVVGAEIARHLGLPLQVVVIRKIQLPWNTEAGFGSVASDGSVLYNEEMLPYLGLTPAAIKIQTDEARRSVEERLRAYHASREFPDLRGRAVILVDDGLASGVTMESAVRMVKNHHPGRMVVAVSTASAGARDRIAPLVDDLICPDVRGGRVFAVADAYENWYDVGDREVKRLLA